MTDRFTVLDITVAIQKGDQVEHTQLAASFDVITTQEAARNVGRQIGAGLGEALALHLQQGKK